MFDKPLSKVYLKNLKRFEFKKSKDEIFLNHGAVYGYKRGFWLKSFG